MPLGCINPFRLLERDRPPRHLYTKLGAVIVVAFSAHELRNELVEELIFEQGSARKAREKGHATPLREAKLSEEKRKSPRQSNITALSN